jgi:ribosomal protein S27AE
VTTQTCLRCQSSVLVMEAYVQDQGFGSTGVLQVGVHRPRRMPTFPGSFSTPVAAVVCGRCGFVELRATDTGGICAAYRRSLSKQIKKARKDGLTPDIRSCPRCVSLLSERLHCDACGWDFKDNPGVDGPA